MNIDEKIILTKRELNEFIKEAIWNGIDIGESNIYKERERYDKEKVAYNNFIEILPTKIKLIFEEEY
jgi:hypothetical protein